MPTIKESQEAKSKFKDLSIEKLLLRETEILTQYNHIESNIPITSDFWVIRNVLRAKRAS